MEKKIFKQRESQGKVTDMKNKNKYQNHGILKELKESHVARGEAGRQWKPDDPEPQRLW